MKTHKFLIEEFNRRSNLRKKTYKICQNTSWSWTDLKKLTSQGSFFKIFNLNICSNWHKVNWHKAQNFFWGNPSEFFWQCYINLKKFKFSLKIFIVLRKFPNWISLKNRQSIVKYLILIYSDKMTNWHEFPLDFQTGCSWRLTPLNFKGLEQFLSPSIYVYLYIYIYLSIYLSIYLPIYLYFFSNAK